MILSGWGRYPRVEANLSAPRNERDLRALVLKGNAIARGNGRAYGDSAVSTHNTLHMKHFNRMLEFDAEHGLLVAQAGVLLADIIVCSSARLVSIRHPGFKFVFLGE